MKAAIQHKNGDPTSPDVLSVVDDAAVPVGDIVKASMTHRTKGKLVLTVSKQ